MASNTVTFRGRAFTVQRVRRPDKSGWAVLWAEVGSAALFAVGDRDQALLQIGEHVAATDPPKAAGGFMEPAPTFASPFDATGARP